MCKVDVAHQAEDERETAGDEEIEPRQRDAVQKRADERLFRDENCVQPDRPDREDQPGEQRCEEEPKQAPALAAGENWRWGLFEEAHMLTRSAFGAPRSCAAPYGICRPS